MSTEQDTIAPTGLEISSNDAAITADSIPFPPISQNRLAWIDFKEGLASWRIWLMLAYQDIKLRYRRSVLGPFWLTISMGITVYAMGYLYAHLFHADLETYYPFLVAGFLGWSLISSIVLDLTDGFSGSDNYIKQVKLPYSLYIHRLTARNIIIFFHNILVIVPILAIYHTHAKVNLHTLLLIPGLCVIYINGVTFGLILAMIGARFRDVTQIIKSLVQVVFFVTPVMWGPEVLGPKGQIIIDLNPFYAFIELIRAPLLGNVPTVKNLTVVAIATSFGLLFSYWIFSRYRARIVYWL